MLIEPGNPYATAAPAVLRLDWDDFRFEISAENRQALGREAQWTVLVYLAADCNLARLMFDDLLEIKAVGSNADLHVLALFDGPLLADSFIARLNPGTRLSDDLVLRFNELNTSQPDTLTLALQIANAFPARHRLVILGGHGAGWHGALVDENAGMHYRKEPGTLVLPGPGSDCDALLKTCQMAAQEELNRIIEQPSGRPPQGVDLLVFDACYMGNLEAMAPVAERAPLLVVAQNAMPGEGIDYRALLEELRNQPATEPVPLARLLVDSTDRFYRTHPAAPRQVTLACLDTAALPTLAESIVELAQALDVRDAATLAAVKGAMHNAWRAPNTGTLDIRGFMLHLLDGPLPATAAEATRRCLERLDAIIIASCGHGGADGPNGLSIYAPLADGFDPAYLRSANELPYNLGIWAWLLGAYYLQRLGAEASDHPLIQSLQLTMHALIEQGVYRPD